MITGAREREILRAVELRADKSFRQLSKELPYREHAIRNCLRRLIEDQTISLKPLISPAAIGYRFFTLYFNLLPGLNPQRKQLPERLLELRESASFLEFSGDYCYALNFYLSEPARLISFLDRTSELVGACYSTRTISTVLSKHLFGRKYLHQGYDAHITVNYLPNGKTEELDQLDKRILNLLATSPCRNARLASRHLSISQATYLYRIRRLEKNGVIPGWTYSIASDKLSLQRSHFLISLAASNEKIRKDFFVFAKTHPKITSVSFTCGSWDIELETETHKSAEITEIRWQIFERFQSCLSGIRILSQFNDQVSQTPLFSVESD